MMENTFTRLGTVVVVFFTLMWLVALAHEGASDPSGPDTYVASALSD